MKNLFLVLALGGIGILAVIAGILCLSILYTVFRHWLKAPLHDQSERAKRRIEVARGDVWRIMRARLVVDGVITPSAPCSLLFDENYAKLVDSSFRIIGQERNYQNTLMECVAQATTKHKLRFRQKYWLNDHLRSRSLNPLPAMSAHDIMNHIPRGQ